MKTVSKYLLLILLIQGRASIGQNETAKWYFGSQAGLDFMTNPPTILTNGVLATTEGCASISDALGNLLFYTDGMTVYNSAHTFMANGTGLFGGLSPAQSCVIIRRPGSQNIYYIFTVIGMCGMNGPAGAYYSIVDMSLAAGQGSVTVKNATLMTAVVSEKITGTRHCNGVDYWVVVEHFQNNVSPAFKSYLLTANGVNTTAVTSPGPSSNNAFCGGCMKISPNGKKLAWANYGLSNSVVFSRCNLFDFDNTTGVVSNSISLSTNTPSLNIWGCYGVEFSPDGTKLFGTHFYNNSNLLLCEGLLQWDICAPSSAAIVASKTVLAVQSPTSWGYLSLQRASDGKIYVARGQFALGVIHNPNVYGAACNYVDLQQSLGTSLTLGGLPNFLGSDFNPPPAALPPFTFTANNSLGCQTASFNAPPIVQNFTMIACAPNGYSLTNLVWNFGDPGSGAANSATVANPTHLFSAPGTYSTSLIVYYSCGGGTDTLNQVVNILPCISVQSQSISCASLGSATASPINGTGPLTYTWMPGAQNGAVATGLIPGTYTIYFNDPNNNQTYTQTLTLVSTNQMTGSLANSSGLNCHAASNGTASVFNIAGGSGTQIYFWTNGTQTSSVANPTNLAAGQWSVTVTDALTACQINSVFVITQPSASTLSLVASSPTTCAGTSITFTATNSGGTAPYTYTWTSGLIAIGPSTDTLTVSESSAGNYVYTVNSLDTNNCLSTQTIAVSFVPNPTLSVSDVSICPLEVGTLTVSGANNYTWSASSTLSMTGASFTQSPVGSTQYTVLGEALGCTSVATASIIVKPLPNPFISHNSPACENANLVFSVSSGTSAVWSGPQSFTSSSINNTVSGVQLNQSGLYQVTVTAANSCTASASVSFTVKPLPQFSIAPASSSICANTTTVSLSVSASTSALSYTWFPNSNIGTNSGTITDAFPGSTTIYTVVGSLNGCTNSAQSTVNVVPPPSLTTQLSSATLCSQAFNGSPNTITLTAAGATTYSLVTVPDMFNSNPGGPVSPLTSIPPYSGIGSATLSGSNGVCTVTTSLTFSILPNPSITVNNYTPVICAGETFTYTNQGANTYTWSSATPNFTSYSNGGVAVAHPSINSVFSVFGGSLGCNSALHITSITVNPLPTVNISPDPLKLCLGNPAELFANSNANSFLWLPPYGLNSYTTQLVTTHINQNQNYTVVATLNNCSNTAVALVSVMPLPSPMITGIKDEVCLFEKIHLKGEGGLQYEWKSPDLQIHYGQVLQLSMSNIGMAGTYTLKIVDANACANYSTYPVIVHALPNGYLIPKQEEFCVPYCNVFEFRSNPENPNIVAANWSMNGVIFSSNTFTYCFNKVGVFNISGPIRDEFNCKNTVSLSVIGRPKPVAEFYITPENPVEGLDAVSFVNVTSNIVGYNWQATGMASSSSSSPLGMTTQAWLNFKSEEENPSYLFEEAGVYGLMLMVRNEYNCVDTVMKTIIVESDFEAYIPNAFTPNADGLNDSFYPVMRGVKEFEFQIFDRWGELIFSSNSHEHVWDGTYKGQDCKQDVYNYKLVLLNVKGEEKLYSGLVTLYR